MDCDIIGSVVGQQIAAMDLAKAYTKLLPHAIQLQALLKRWSGMQLSAQCFGNERILINVSVVRVKDIEALLEFLEVGLNCNFDDTSDRASASYAWRTFTASDCSWLRVDANLQADGPGCHKVKVGMTEPQPIYEIQCLAEVDAPQSLEGPSTEQLPAPASGFPALPDDDIPF